MTTDASQGGAAGWRAFAFVAVGLGVVAAGGVWILWMMCVWTDTPAWLRWAIVGVFGGKAVGLIVLDALRTYRETRTA